MQLARAQTGSVGHGGHRGTGVGHRGHPAPERIHRRLARLFTHPLGQRGDRPVGHLLGQPAGRGGRPELVQVDAPIGQGHVVMFANRPFWRWQTQGNFFLGFNTILNWNDLDAGRTAAVPTAAQQQR